MILEELLQMSKLLSNCFLRGSKTSLRLVELLEKWNKNMNLTGITEKDQVYLKHFYDSLTISKVIDLDPKSTRLNSSH